MNPIYDNVINELFDGNIYDMTVEKAIWLSGCSYLKSMKETKQDSLWHAEGNVHIHTDMVLNETYSIIENENLSMNEKIMLIAGSLFHDLGKPLVTKEKEIDGMIRTVAPKHPNVGASLFNLYSNEFQLKEPITDLIRYHHEPKKLVKNNLSKFNYWYITRTIPGKLLYYLEIADINGRICDDKDVQIEILEEFRMFCEEYNCFDNVSPYYSYIDGHKKFNDNMSEQNQQRIIKELIDDSYDIPEEIVGKYYNKPRGEFVLLCGLSGSGKSTIAKDYENNGYCLISPDNFRDGCSKRDRKDAVSKSKQLYKQYLSSKHNIIWDATNLKSDIRKKLLTLAEDNGYHTTIIFIDRTLNDCVKQNRDRNEKVGDNVLEKQSKKFELPEPKESHNFIIK